MTTPHQRTLDWLANQGFERDTVERIQTWRRKGKNVVIRRDFLGCIDIVAVGRGRTIGYNATSTDNAPKRVTKAIAEPRLRAWLEAGNEFFVIGWAKRGAHGTRKLWTHKLYQVTLADLPIAD